ncbi:GC-rich sequence DNA-binding factor 2 [Dissostichus eleginoides]|uniref:GC-rich sequence DNA-binding factor 2 n=1 Tax=Dissostichus eleginoides TaxID=100907 RepID=A0AAD9F6F1_DISEL|nr:GC-rich sequence DNA-binding factor 2 [Dissostichus eleginoides]
MFNKKPRRNFRQRKDNSSDEEDERKTRGHGVETEEAPVAVNKPEKLSQGRGITCSSKREATPPKPGSSSGEDGDTVEVTEEGGERNKDRDEVQKTTNSILSFSDDKEAKEPTFKLKKSSDKAVLFQVKKRKHHLPRPNKEELAQTPSALLLNQQSSLMLKRSRQLDGSVAQIEPRKNSFPWVETATAQLSIRERIADKLGDSDDSLSGSDVDEQDLWEETQIEKGVKRRPGEQSPSGRLKIPTFPAVSVSMVKKRITGKLESLKEVHSARQAELRRMEGDAENARASAETLEESSSERQLRFYRDTNLYVHNVVECLREKVVEINSVELDLHSLLSDHMEALLAQRRQRTREQADRLQQISYGTKEQGGSPTNGTETQSGADSGVKAEEDFDLPEDTQPSAEEEEQLQKKIADILLRSQAVFSDVQDDFSSVKKILSRFEEWRGSYSDSYHNAYISLCLPKLLNPIIRHQLLPWNPLKSDSGDFENFPWFAAVETFCHGHGHEELENTDRQTLSNVIEKTVIPKLTGYVELVWDPMSRQQSVCVSDVCHRLKEDYSIFEGEQSKPVKAFREAVISKLRSCVDDDVFIPLYPKTFLEDSSSPQCRFRDQQFWTAIKLLGNMGKWDLLLPESVLKELMLDKLLNRYLLTALCSQTLSNRAVHACRKIADSLPLSWFKGENSCLPQLQNFRNHLVQKAHSICKQQPPEEPNTKSAVVEVLKILSSIRCNDSIMAISEKYRYEDVIYSHQLLNHEDV